jgi:eukaryotic-like serine/threonine-protein kinase
MSPESQTLSTRLAEKPLTIFEALRCAAGIGSALQRLHLVDNVHGALTPDCVLLDGTAIRLSPGETGPATSYAAPEVLNGQNPDARSDIFSFGALLYEMLTGRRPYAATAPEELAAEIAARIPTPIGDPGQDRLIAKCLAATPDARWQNMWQVLMEIRLLAIVAQSSESNLAHRQHKFEEAVQAELLRHQTAMGKLEQAVVDQSRALESAVSDTLNAMQAQLSAGAAALAVSTGPVVDNHATTEALDSVRLDLAELRERLDAAVRATTKESEARSAVVASIQGDVARLDQLMESVVDALETVQGMVLEQTQPPEESIVIG